MREVKFRAFDKVNEEMYYDVQCNRSSIYTSILYLDLNRIATDPRFILMQYIGLNDKNGKEVYEEDIVQLIYDGIEEPEIYVGIIKYNLNTLSYVLDTGGSFENLSEFDLEKLEIIANTCENVGFWGKNERD